MGNVLAVFLFEWKRSLTLPRMAWSFVLAGFPVFIVGLIRFIANTETPPDPPPPELWIVFFFALIPMLVTMLGTLLWTTPAISAELERRSWTYLAVRPNGGTAVLLGKYLAAVTWVLPPALIGLSIAVPLSGIHGPWRIWWVMFRLVCLSCPAYAAIYLLIGTIMPRRAMVLAVAYSLILEFVVSFVPAVINKLTVHYRLRSLLVEWCEELAVLKAREAGVFSIIDDSPAWQQVVILMSMTATLLFVSVVVLRISEFSSSSESDV